MATTGGQFYSRVAVLYLRYRGKAQSITVNGISTPLVKLGHNAAEPDGWHPYVVNVPAVTTYHLEYNGEISLIGQFVRVVMQNSNQDSG